MSWIFGAITKHKQLNPQKYKSFLHSPLFNHVSDNYFVAAGGNSRTCFFSSLKGSGWIACGVGLETNQDKTLLLNNSDWGNLCEPENIFVENLDGHFVIVKWKDGIIELQTDSLGLREFYICKTPSEIIFTTRLDWIANFIKTEIDFKEFGSRWLLFNQVTDKSFLKNITRIVSGTKVKIENHTIKIEKKEWQPSSNCDWDENEFKRRVRNLIFPDSTLENLELSLSGGMDSRFLLSFLINSNREKWVTHTFGNLNHPDNQLANKLSAAHGFNHKNIYEPLPETDSLVEELQNFAIQMQIVNPISTYLPLRYYPLFHEDTIVIDGGFGEIWRQEFLFRLQTAGKEAVRNSNTENVLKYLTVNKPNIFSKETIELMFESSKYQLYESFNEMPNINDIGLDNWVTLFSLRTRLKNYYSTEQVRVDNYVVSYMPLVQPSLIKYLFRLNPKFRRNGNLFRKIIKENCKSLSTFTLVKGNITHPYSLTSLQSRVWAKFMRKMKREYYDSNRIELLLAIKDYIVDITNSLEVKNYDHYNYSGIKRIVNNFYNGDLTSADDLDWWLSFELFRGGLSEGKLN
jgi:hypothetical protein